MHSDPLEILLEQTRQALLEGDLTALDGLARETGAALADAAEIEPESLERIREMAGANATLIEAAIRGVAAAKGRLQRPECFSTYDSRGQRDAIRPEDSGRARRL